LQAASQFPHLPPGHEPGPQSRRRKSSRRWGLWLCVAFAAFFAGLGIYGGANPGKSSPGVFYGVFGGMALFMLLLAWFIAGRTRPKRAVGFEVSASPVELRRGDTVGAQLRIDDPQKVDGDLRVGLICTEYYDVKREVVTQDGTSTQRVTHSVTAHEEWTSAAAGELLQSFKFRIPETSPFSHEGTVLSFCWRVSAKVPRGGRRDPSSDQPIWVRP
jgi:hypothetical protein